MKAEVDHAGCGREIRLAASSRSSHTVCTAGLGTYANWDERLDGLLAWAVMSLRSQPLAAAWLQPCGCATDVLQTVGPVSKIQCLYTRAPACTCCLLQSGRMPCKPSGSVAHSHRLAAVRAHTANAAQPAQRLHALAPACMCCPAAERAHLQAIRGCRPQRCTSSEVGARASELRPPDPLRPAVLAGT